MSIRQENDAVMRSARAQAAAQMYDAAKDEPAILVCGEL